MINLAATVRKFSKKLARRQFGPEMIVDGYANAPAQTDGFITGYVVPVTGRNIQQLPEGCRETSSHVMYTVNEVATVSTQIPQSRADWVFFEGFWHMVMGVADHSQQGKFSIVGIQRLGSVPNA